MSVRITKPCFCIAAMKSSARFSSESSSILTTPPPSSLAGMAPEEYTSANTDKRWICAIQCGGRWFVPHDTLIAVCAFVMCQSSKKQQQERWWWMLRHPSKKSRAVFLFFFTYFQFPHFAIPQLGAWWAFLAERRCWNNKIPCLYVGTESCSRISSWMFGKGSKAWECM